jgi:serine protease Do
MDPEDRHDIELMRELNQRYRDDQPDRYAAAQRRKRLMIQLAAFFVVLIFTFTMAGSWLRTFNYPSLRFLRESWELSRDPQIRELRQAVVRIEAHQPGTIRTAAVERKGTGFNIGASGWIVTNRHLVEDADRITVSFAGSGRHRAVAWYWSDTADLALIRLQTEDLPVVHLDMDYHLSPGEGVIIIGNPLSFTGIALRGQVEAAGQVGRSGEPVVVVSAPIHPGHSGSPLFNEAGRVVGVVYAAVSTSDGDDPKGLAVSISALEELLTLTGFPR